MMRYIVFLFLLLFSVPQSQAGINVSHYYSQRDTAGTTTSGGSAALSVLSNVNTSGSSLIVVAVHSYGVATAPTLTDNQGNSYGAGQLAASADAPSSGPRLRVWYIYGNGIGSATHTFSVTTSAPGFRTIYVVTATGTMFTADPKDQVTTSSIVGMPNPSVTPSQDNELVLSFVTSSPNAVAPTLSGSFTLMNSWGFLSSGSFLGADAYLIQTAASTATPVFNYSGVYSAAATISFKAAPSNNTSNFFNLLLR